MGGVGQSDGAGRTRYATLRSRSASLTATTRRTSAEHRGGSAGGSAR
ncbi:DUF6380 family protein [Streptomyces sp. NPDC005423]